MEPNGERQARLLSRGQIANAMVMSALFVAATISAAFADPSRMVGVAYSTWHTSHSWQNAWGTPSLGSYLSSDKTVITQHANWLSDAGVDFIFVDWSNDIPYSPGSHCCPGFKYLEEATYTLFDTYKDLAKHPKIAIMLGFQLQPSAPVDGRLQRKADQVYEDFIANGERASLYQHYEGKPLLIVYTGTPTPFRTGLPPWNDSRFTVRYMTGFVTEQPGLLGPDQVSKFGYWSWEDRAPQSYTVEDGQPEAMTVNAAFPYNVMSRKPGLSRKGGTTFITEWARARAKGVKLALVVSWNEWWKKAQLSAELGKDLEPSAEFGDFYLKLLKDQITQFKGH